MTLPERAIWSFGTSRVTKAALQAEAEHIRDDLTTLLGSPVPLRFEAGSASPLKLPGMTADAMVNRALQNRPDLDALETLAEAARGELQATKKARLPTFSLSAGVKGEYDLDGNERGADFRAGATSRWFPISGGEHKANVELAEAELRQAELELAHARRSTISGINGALAQAKAAERAAEANYRALENARNAQKLSQQVFDHDATHIDPLVESHEDVARTLATHADNQAALDLALIKIHHLLGQCGSGEVEAKTSIVGL